MIAISDQQAATVAELLRRHGLELLRFAYLLCGDRQRGEDLLQDVLLAMHRRFPDTLPLENPVGYARRALANANVSRVRRLASTEWVTDTLPAFCSRPASWSRSNVHGFTGRRRPHNWPARR